MRLLVTTRDERWQRPVAQAATGVDCGMSFNYLVGAGEPYHWDLRPMPCSVRLILEDQAEQEMHVAAVGSAFRRLGSIGSPHLVVPSDIRFKAA
jgi:hypothetical protein